MRHSGKLIPNKSGIFLFLVTGKKKKKLTLMIIKYNPSRKGPKNAAIFKPLSVEGAGSFVAVHHCRSPPHYSRFSSDNLTNDWLCLGDPAAQSAQERVDEIAGQIMLLADASLITALLSISNYTGCLAEREGR